MLTMEDKWKIKLKYTAGEKAYIFRCVISKYVTQVQIPAIYTSTMFW